MGASLGQRGRRNCLPPRSPAACAIARRARWQRQLLVACGAGAGMAAVYENVPLGGALFALEVLLGTLTLPLVLPALLTSVIATAVAWIALPVAPTYAHPQWGVTGAQLVWAALIGPLAGLAAVVWVRLIQRMHGLRPRGCGRLIAPIAVLALLGFASIQYPQLLGNGQDTVQLALTGGLSVGVLGVLVVFKPTFTAGCLGSGAPGGLFTPTLTFGVLLGSLLGHAWGLVWSGTPEGSYALIGGAAVLAASMQGPLASVVLILELAHHTDTLMVPMLLAVGLATVVARRVGAPSIYSARLGDRGRSTSGPPLFVPGAVG